jgi:hypothetical protein
VVAQEEVLPHFSSREYVYSFPAIPDYRQTDYLVARRGRLFYNFHKGVLDSWMSTGYFETVVDKDGLMLAGRKMPETSPNIRFGDSMILLGYTLFPPTPWKGGTVSRPIVTWQATKRITEKYSIAIQVVDQQGHVWSRTIGEPHNGVTPTTQWKVGKPVGDQYQLNLPPTMPTGDYQIALEVHNSDGAYLEAFDSEGTLIGTGLVLSTVRIEKDKSSVTASQLEMGHRLYVDIQEMRLLGFELDRRQFKVRDTLELGLYWRARAKPQEDYVVKTQLCDSAGRVVFEETSRPAQGAYPTTEWNAGEVLLDWHDWRIPDSLSDGAYTLKVSLIQTPNGTILGEAELADITITGTDGVP